MSIRRLAEKPPEQGIHEKGYPANEPPPEAAAAVDHSSYGLTEDAKTKLKTIAGNIIYCEERAKEVAEEKRTFFAEAKAAGFDSTALRQAIAFLKNEADKTEQEQIRDLYVEALRERE